MRRRDAMTFLCGAMMVMPGASWAQRETRVPRIGVLWHAGNENEERIYLTALREGFHDMGYIEGKTIVLENRFPNEEPERMLSMASELAALPVDILIAATTSPAIAAQRATTTIPVIFVAVFDPIASKLVSNLPRPGGNITGFTHITAELTAKRLQILKEAIPWLSRAALLVNSTDETTRHRYIEESRVAAAALGITVQPVAVRSLDDFDRAFDQIVTARAAGVCVGANGLFFQGREVMAKLALKHRLPLVVYSLETFEAGALMSYGADIGPMFRRVAIYVDKILNGAKVGDLPVEQPTTFQFRINLNVAKTLGITIPPLLLARATEVIA
jgi:putative ABC transport system substrate-binding protein